MAIETLRSLYRQAGHDDLRVPALRKSAMAPYDAGGMGRRSYGWQPSRLGQNTLLVTNLEQIRSRSREAIRNNAWATAAINRFESNVIGTGIQPHWQHPDQKVRDKIHCAWERWQKKADYLGQNDFYTMQAIVAREVFEAGEVFSRHRLRPTRDKLFVPYQIQLIEGEQLPVFLNQIGSNSRVNSIKAGIEFDPDMRRLQYHFYAEHPGEAMLYPSDAMRYIQVPASQIRHVYKPRRAGQLRGEPEMVAVLALLHELDQYEDASVVKKKIQTMFAAFIQKQAPEVDVLPVKPADQPTAPQTTDPGVANAKIETGTIQELLPGETITFPNIASETDFDAFMKWALHKFAAGVGLTYEQITGDLTGVNYSSIRAGMLEFRRSCEQFQMNIIVHQFCQPVLERWLDEAMLCGALNLPGYFDDPTPYQSVMWVPPGWAWVDPLKEAQAAQMDVRSGFTARTFVVRGKGLDPAVVDQTQATERKNAARLGLIYDSDANRTLTRGVKNPSILVDADPDQGDVVDDESGEGGHDDEAIPPIKPMPTPAPAGPAPGSKPKPPVN